MKEIKLFAINYFPEVKPEDNIGELIVIGLQQENQILQNGDILIIASKIVSKSEGCIICQEEIIPSSFAKTLSALTGRDSTYMEVVLQQTTRAVKMAKGLFISRTKHGFILANAGVDASNSGRQGLYTILPEDPDKSAELIKETLYTLTGKKVGVIIADTFGRPWRKGQTNLAIGVSGIGAFRDYTGERDHENRVLKYTQVAIADEMASAAELLSGKNERKPVVVLRGYDGIGTIGRGKDIPYAQEQDIFL